MVHRILSPYFRLDFDLPYDSLLSVNDRHHGAIPPPLFIKTSFVVEKEG